MARSLSYICSLVVGLSFFSGFAQNQSVEQRVESILGQMTAGEKLDYIGGIGFAIRAIPRLGLPEILMSDGPVGVRNYGPATSYPAGIALTATWNTDLAGRMGLSLGRDARARGVHILLGPGLNIYRSPLCGRNFEYLGEDPLLASRMVVPLVRGIQEQGVLATLKHYACNNQEYDRHSVSSDLNERTLREIYLPAFQAGVVEGHAGCVMSAYNPVNGTHCTENEFLNNTILKGEWGFDGILMSDWGATYDGIAAANGGLDLEMPTGAHLNSSLLAAIQAGLVPQAAIDDKVRRILRKILQMGFPDRPQLDSSIPLADPSSNQTALEIARESVVLLKNEGPILPLARDQGKSILVIGDNAHPGVPAGGGSSYTAPIQPISVTEGLEAVAGPNFSITHLPTPYLPYIRFETTDQTGSVQPGFSAAYFANRSLFGVPTIRRVDTEIAFDWENGSPHPSLPADGFSVRWESRLKVDQSGVIRFETRSDDGIRVYLDGVVVLDDWSDHSARPIVWNVQVSAGEVYELTVEYYENTGRASVELSARVNPNQGALLEYLDEHGSAKPGLLGEYFNNTQLSGTPAFTRVDDEVNFEWGAASPVPGLSADGFSVRWSGRIRFSQSGKYQFTTRSDDGIRLYLDGRLLIHDWSDHAARSTGAVVSVEADRNYSLVIEYYEGTGDAVAQFSWWPVFMSEVVRTADIALICAGFDSESEGEGFDRTFFLPGGEAAMISEVAAANPNTVVVLFGGGAMDMQGWLGAVDAVLHAWYPGQNGGRAIAEVLFGEVNPSGKLPVTFERQWEENPVYPHYHAPAGGATRYEEGVFVGYRGFDRAGLEPLFPFGFGLSYTSFEYSDLEIAPGNSLSGTRLQVSFSVKNTGTRAGAEVTQIYVEPPESPVERPVLELKGFEKVFLQPGGTRRVTVQLNQRSLSYFDTAAAGWKTVAGVYGLAVGASSRDVRLRGQFRFTPPNRVRQVRRSSLR